ncbi:MAG: FtsX-like permease family protein [Bifidobacteriaceae bacterium]|jgi:putative ABC transport system permease protein|nr:FtsX-like permease family protein [Bifidobacteriaceae bacterium]
MWRVAWRSIRAHWGRFALSVCAVVLGVAFWSGTLQLRAQMDATFDAIVDVSADSDVYVRGSEVVGQEVWFADVAEDRRNDFPAALVDTVRQVEGVSEVQIEIDGSGLLVGSDGTPVAKGGAPGVFIGWEPGYDTEFAQGRGPRDASEVALEASTAELAGLGVGDRTSIMVGAELRPVTVTGIATMTSMAGASVVLMDLGTALADFNPDGLIEFLSVDSDTLSPEALAEAVASVLPPGAEAVSGEAIRDESRELIASILGMVETLMLVFAGMALFLGGFIIVNTFTMTVRERTPEFALLRAVGASPAQVFSVVLGQAAVVGLIGAAAGIAVGVGMLQVIRAVMRSGGLELEQMNGLTWGNVLGSVAIGLVAAVLSAAVPARRAAQVPPVRAMGAVGLDAGRPLRLRGALGTVLLGGGVGCAVAAVILDDAAPRLPLLGVGAVAVLLGALVAAPAAARPALGLLGWPLAFGVRPTGRFAVRNVTRNPRRTASTAGALMIGMALVSGAAVLAASFQVSVKEITRGALLADLYVAPLGPVMPAGAAEAVETAEGVALADRTYGVEVQIGEELLSLTAADRAVLGRSVEVELTEGSWGAVETGGVAVAAPVMRQHGWSLGDRITLTSEAGAVGVRIGAALRDAATVGPMLGPLGVLDQLVAAREDALRAVFVKGEPGVAAADLHRAVSGAVEPFVVVAVMDPDEFIDNQSAQIDTMLALVYALLAMSLVIAALGIVNTLALSMLERRRETGLLRAVGLGRAQLRAMVSLEAVLLAVFGAVAGLAIGVGLAAALPSVLADQGLRELAVPWGQLAAMLALTCVAAVAAAAWPAFRAARVPVLDAIAA